MKYLLQHYPELSDCFEDIQKAGDMMLECIKNGGKLLVAGNGGSCADSEHIVGELMKCFKQKRPMSTPLAKRFRELYGDDAEHFVSSLEGAIPAIALGAHSALATAYLNDNEPGMLYAQAVYGYGKPKDLFWGLSTSGNSENVVNAAMTAKAMGLLTVAMTGEKHSRLSALCDCTIRVPSSETYRIQEYHLPIYHAICAYLEKNIFG